MLKRLICINAMKTLRILLPLAALLATSVSFGQDKSVTEILPAKLHNAKGEEVDAAELEGKTVALYFSAHWCPPCRMFTPSLVKFRDDNAENDFEIVFASLDNSDEEKSKYIDEAEMKWLTIPGARSEDTQKLAEKYGVRGIPALIVLDAEGNLVTADGRSDVSGDPEGALKKWQKKS